MIEVPTGSMLATIANLNAKFPLIAEEVKKERLRQIAKRGDKTRPPEKTFVILGEEVGEIARAILERDCDNYREELIQVAAVCIKAIEDYDNGVMP